ncbi:MAG TPA: nicotinamide-nucleotide amidase [Gammaproteobacteria bacterium]|nr:nicotinamide-nucleotide amidase [Gammaproteobacteria bacterium]
MNNEHRQLARALLDSCTAAKLRIATAESCTGGWVAKVMTDLAGSSAVFDRGFVTYSNEAKMEMLGVNAETLNRQGAVSKQTVLEMATGALQQSQAQLSVSISGIAGPGGGSIEKPVGTVWFAWAREGTPPTAIHHHFYGNRDVIRHQAVTTALTGLLDLLPDPS